MSKLAHLILSDGSVFEGQTLVDGAYAIGELVFSTSTTGYAELLTDPSYYGQMVVMANPEIGNYGVNAMDFQSDRIKVRGLVVRNLSPCASSYRSQMTLSDWLIREQIPVIFGIDTRKLIAHLRDHGSMNAVIATACTKTIVEHHLAARAHHSMEGLRLSSHVAVKAPERWNFPLTHGEGHTLTKRAHRYRVVALDFGMKRSIARYLTHCGAELTVIPGDSSVDNVWMHKPDGVFLSNGPGDPQTETRAVQTVRSLIGKVPIFGVCLGHQILAQALSCSTYKLAFGHRGSNQAVRTEDGRILTTAQNHGFAVEPKPQMHELVNISDGTNEGIDLKNKFAFSVQFHPEGAPGPKDAVFYFEKFMTYIDKWKESCTDDGYGGAHVRRMLPLE
jgi:carbamoyl-phosphate synthase small subunit